MKDQSNLQNNVTENSANDEGAFQEETFLTLDELLAAEPSDKSTEDAEEVTVFEDIASATPEYRQEAVRKEQERMEKRKKRKKNHRRNVRSDVIKSIVWIVSIVVVSLLAAYGIVRVVSDFLGIGFDLKHGFGREGVHEIVVEKGDTAQVIINKLADQEVINTPIAFRLYAKLNHYDSKFTQGIHTFNGDYSYSDIANELMTPGIKAAEVTVLIAPGASLNDIARLMEENHVCRASDFLKLTGNFSKGIDKLNAEYGKKFDYSDFKYDFVKEIPVENRRLEGYLLPDTYRFYAHFEEEYAEMPHSVDFAYIAIDKMLKNLDDQAGEQLRKRAAEGKYTFHQLVTMASMIQMEAGKAQLPDMQKVAQVFCNRMEGINWEGPRKLQSDPTVTYAKQTGLLQYDTYENEGLPPAPMGAMNANCLLAAASPDKKSKATYFVTDKNGKFYFSDTLGQHNSTIASLKSKGLWFYTTF